MPRHADREVALELTLAVVSERADHPLAEVDGASRAGGLRLHEYEPRAPLPLQRAPDHLPAADEVDVVPAKARKSPIRAPLVTART